MKKKNTRNPMAKSLNKSSIQNEIILNLYPSWLLFSNVALWMDKLISHTFLCFLKRFCCKITGRLVSQIQMKPSSVKNPLIKTSKRHKNIFLWNPPKSTSQHTKKSYLFHLKRFHFIQKKKHTQKTELLFISDFNEKLVQL